MVIFSLWNSFVKMAVTSYFIDLLVNKEPFEGKTEGNWIKKKREEEISFCPEERSSSISISKGERQKKITDTNKQSQDDNKVNGRLPLLVDKNFV